MASFPLGPRGSPSSGEAQSAGTHTCSQCLRPDSEAQAAAQLLRLKGRRIHSGTVRGTKQREGDGVPRTSPLEKSVGEHMTGGLLRPSHTTSTELANASKRAPMAQAGPLTQARTEAESGGPSGREKGGASGWRELGNRKSLRPPLSTHCACV